MWIDPGEPHWRGAAPGSFMAHLGVGGAAEDGSTVQWHTNPWGANLPEELQTADLRRSVSLVSGPQPVLAVGATRAAHQPNPGKGRVLRDSAGHPFSLMTSDPARSSPPPVASRIQLWCFRLVQRARGTGGRGGGGDALAAQHVEVRVPERGERGDLVLSHLDAIDGTRDAAGAQRIAGPPHDPAGSELAAAAWKYMLLSGTPRPVRRPAGGGTASLSSPLRGLVRVHRHQPSPGIKAGPRRGYE